MKLRGMKYKVLQVSAFSSYLSSLNLYFYVLTLSVYDVGFGRFHILIIFSILVIMTWSMMTIVTGHFCSFQDIGWWENIFWLQTLLFKPNLSQQNDIFEILSGLKLLSDHKQLCSNLTYPDIIISLGYCLVWNYCLITNSFFKPNRT